MPGFEIIDEAERKEVLDVLDTGVLHRYGFDALRKGHWKAKTFEAEFAARTGAKHCLLVSNGTAALATALAATGVGAGDEVIIPPFTFVATFEAVVWAGAIPVFAEIDHTLCLDPESVESKITSKTKAVLTVHMCGSMAHIEALKSLCDRKGLILIEDVAQSVGGTFQGKGLGTFGRMGCFSFDPVKTITCGEGGAVITDDEALYQKADYHADHGHDHVSHDRGLDDHPILGNNFRISELQAAIGLAQLRKLDHILETQRRHKKQIKDALKALSGVSFREIPDENGDTATFLNFFMPTASQAQQVCQDLAKAGIGGCFYWYDNKWHYLRQWDHFKTLTAAAKLPIQLISDLPDYANVELPQSDAIMRRLVTMAIGLSATDSDIEQRKTTTVDVVEKALAD